MPSRRAKAAWAAMSWRLSYTGGRKSLFAGCGGGKRCCSCQKGGAGPSCGPKAGGGGPFLKKGVRLPCSSSWAAHLQMRIGRTRATPRRTHVRDGQKP